MGSFLETQITNRDREKTEIGKDLAEVGGLEGLQKQKKSDVSCRKRAENTELTQKDLSHDLASSRRKLTKS